jgi:beta-phosphoglucomutase
MRMTGLIAHRARGAKRARRPAAAGGGALFRLSVSGVSAKARDMTEVRGARPPAVAVIFDMDGVLVDTNPYHRRAWLAFAAEIGRGLTDAALRDRVFGWRTEEAIGNLWGPLPTVVVADYAARKEALYRELIRREIRPVAGLHAFLGRLQAGGVRRALATSACRENVALIVGALGLGTAFAPVVFGEEVVRAKPDPAVFLLAARRLAADPARCLVIEDSLSGVAAAKAAGMRCLALTTTHTAAELRAAGADGAVADFDAIPDALWSPA